MRVEIRNMYGDRSDFVDEIFFTTKQNYYRVRP